MKKSLLKILFFSIISSHVFIAESLKALIPYYYLPETKSLQEQGLSIGKKAYQLLYFGQIEDSLNLAKLAVKMNNTNETLFALKKSGLKLVNLDTWYYGTLANFLTKYFLLSIPSFGISGFS